MPVVQYDWDEIEDNIDEEFDENGNTIVKYTTEPDYHGNVISQLRDGVTSTFHFDGIGSTIVVTNDAADVTDTFAYSAFGSVTHRTGTTDIAFTFVGQKGYYFDSATNDYYVRRRTHRSNIGRWMSVDPLVFLDSSDVYMFSAYQYSFNSPLNYADPSGLWGNCRVCRWRRYWTAKDTVKSLDANLANDAVSSGIKAWLEGTDKTDFPAFDYPIPKAMGLAPPLKNARKYTTDDGFKFAVGEREITYAWFVIFADVCETKPGDCLVTIKEDRESYQWQFGKWVEWNKPETVFPHKNHPPTVAGGNAIENVMIDNLITPPIPACTKRIVIVDKPQTISTIKKPGFYTKIAARQRISIVEKGSGTSVFERGWIEQEFEVTTRPSGFTFTPRGSAIDQNTLLE